MFEDAPVNIGAVEWPDPDSAHFTVRRMQTKLHRWATEDPGRRFGDLFNLVYDPAFLVVAWERVSTNQGAKTAGIDKATAAQIETWVGVEAFLQHIRVSLKSGEFQPVEVRQVVIPKGKSGKFRKLDIPTIADPRSFQDHVSLRILKGRCMTRPASRLASAMSRRPARWWAPTARLRRPAMTRGPDLVRTVELSSR
jgi:hypothetical protein